MKFSCKTQNLKNAISKIERLVSKQTTLPILSNILIATEKGRLSLAATNLEIAIKVFIGAKIEKEGSITVPAKILSGFLSNINDDVVEASLKETDFLVKTKEHKIKIKGISAADFPIIPDSPQNYFFKIDQLDFSTILSSILVSVGKNDSRMELNGVFMEFGEKELILAATDSFRLSEAIIAYKKGSTTKEFEIFKKQTPSLIVPALTFSEIQKIASQEGEVSFAIDQSQLFVSSNSTRIISRLINGNYPEYKQVLPKEFKIEIKVEKEKIVNAVKISSLLAVGRVSEVKIEKLAKEENKLTISSQMIDLGENISKIEAQVKGENFEVFFNSQYLLDGLNLGIFSGEKILMKMNPEKSPVIIRGFNEDGKEDENFSYVVMPIIKQ